MQCSALQYIAIQCSTMQYSAVLGIDHAICLHLDGYLKLVVSSRTAVSSGWSQGSVLDKYLECYGNYSVVT